jgi:hypothetical protein
MKKLLLILTIGTLFVSCSTSKNVIEPKNNPHWMVISTGPY